MLKEFSKCGRIECGLDSIVAGKCWAFVPVLHRHGGFGLGVAVANEPGYYPIAHFWCHADSYAEASDHAAALNAAEGLNVEVAMRVVCSSMAAGRLNRGRAA